MRLDLVHDRYHARRADDLLEVRDGEVGDTDALHFSGLLDGDDGLPGVDDAEAAVEVEERLRAVLIGGRELIARLEGDRPVNLREGKRIHAVKKRGTHEVEIKVIGSELLEGEVKVLLDELWTMGVVPCILSARFLCEKADHSHSLDVMKISLRGTLVVFKAWPTCRQNVSICASKAPNPYLFLVAVDESGVDMPVANLQRVLDGSLDFTGLAQPGTQTDLGDLIPVLAALQLVSTLDDAADSRDLQGDNATKRHC